VPAGEGMYHRPHVAHCCLDEQTEQPGTVYSQTAAGSPPAAMYAALLSSASAHPAAEAWLTTLIFAVTTVEGPHKISTVAVTVNSAPTTDAGTQMVPDTALNLHRSRLAAVVPTQVKVDSCCRGHNDKDAASKNSSTDQHL